MRGMYDTSDRKVSVSAETETEYSADTEYSVVFEYSVSAEYSVPYANRNRNPSPNPNKQKLQIYHSIINLTKSLWLGKLKDFVSVHS